MTDRKIFNFYQLIAWVAFITLCILWLARADAGVPSHTDCVAYWSHRTATWQHAPSVAQIENDNIYCGGLL
ncbi:MAG: hypothetical protein NC548_44440 [Lachnospiraceae bacterium]|nr:hypothetical protein [Lachnospiraceae bacterium]